MSIFVHSLITFFLVKKMEQLRTILFSENSELRTTKNLSNMDNAVKNALTENSKEAIDLLCDYFFSIEACSPLQTFCKHTQEIIKKQNLTGLFEEEASKKLDESFWSNTDINQNLTAVSNALSLCGREFIFEGKENELVTKFATIFQDDEEKLLSEENFTSASKIIEAFVEYFAEPHNFQFNSFVNPTSFLDEFLPFIEVSSTFSILSTSILKIIQHIPSFDSTFSFIRSLAILLCNFLPEQIITSLYSTTESTEGENLSSILSNYFNDYQLLLFLSVIGRNLKNQEFCNFCFSTIKELTDLNNISRLTVIDRIFLYNSMNQISPLVTPLNDFIDFYGESLLRDFDSSNNLITSALRSIFQTTIKSVSKRSEKADDDHTTEEEICQQLLTFINPLSFVSKLKTWLLPLLLKHIDSKSIPNDQLIKMAQDPSAGNFVSKCVKCIRGDQENGQGWLNLIEKCKEEAIKKCRACGDMIVLRPILEPTFENYPESIDHAFQTFQLTPIPLIDTEKKNSNEPSQISPEELALKNGTFDDIWVITTWLMFECLLSSPRSKWKLTNDQIRLLINVAIKCGNWDVRSSSFTVFTVAGFPQNSSDIDFILSSFENLLFFDSPRHISQVKATFVDFIERINKRSKTLKEDQIRKIEEGILNIVCSHMIPSYISSHRQFAFDIAKPILEANPSLILETGKEENNSCLRSVLSLFLDSNSSLSNSSVSLVRKLMNKDEEIKQKVLKFEEVRSFVSPDSKKSNQGNNNNNDKDEEDAVSIASILSQVEDVENWEEQCDLFEEMNRVISTGKVPQEEIVEASEKLFNILIKTRILGVTCRGQIALESIARRITPVSKLESMLDRWTSDLLSTLDHFDMENMRRSAALPYLALSIMRLNTPDIMQTKHSIFEKLVNRLVEVIKSSKNNEDSQEATHSLNMIRAVLTDKVTSPLSEVILPSVFESIFIVLEKIDNWDLVTAANLCLAAVIRKIKKKNVGQEDDNDTKSSNDSESGKKKNRKMRKNQQSLLLNQFFNKMPNSKESIVNGLKSKSSHLNYLSLLTLSSFDSNSTSAETDTKLQSLVISHLMESRDSRMRRLASRAVVAVTNEKDLVSLFGRTIENLSHKSFNALHGQVMLLREVLQHAELIGMDNGEFVTVGETFPSFNWLKIPPFIYDDLFFVLRRIGRSDMVPESEVHFDEFYYDQVSLFLHRPTIGQPLPVSAIVALLLRINASGRINEIDVVKKERNGSEVTNEDDDNDRSDFTIPIDLKEQIVSNVLVADFFKVNDSLLFAGLNFLIENPPNPDEINSDLLVHLIKQKFQSNIAAALIHLLFIALSSESSTTKARLALFDLFDVLESYVLDLSEEMTPVHVSIAELLPLLLSLDNIDLAQIKEIENKGEIEGQIDYDRISRCRSMGFGIALRLLIDDVPKVRTMTMLAVSDSFGIGLTSEIILFEKVLRKLRKENENVIKRLLLQWIKLIYAKIETDTHGEALCVIVDEFFIVRKLSEAIGIDLNYDLHKITNLLNMRKGFAATALKVVTDQIEGKSDE